MEEKYKKIPQRLTNFKNQAEINFLEIQYQFGYTQKLLLGPDIFGAKPKFAFVGYLEYSLKKHAENLGFITIILSELQESKRVLLDKIKKQQEDYDIEERNTKLKTNQASVRNNEIIESKKS